MKMNKKEFWKIIDDSRLASNGDYNLFQAKTVKLLSKCTAEQIIEFEMILRELIIESDDYRIIAVYKIIMGMLSDDSYLYLRCWLIGQGEEAYQQTLRNPDHLVNIIDEKSNLDFHFEDLLYVATEAYKEKVGRITEDDSFSREIAYKMGLIYDCGASSTKGRKYSEKELPNVFPNLWERFGVN